MMRVVSVLYVVVIGALTYVAYAASDDEVKAAMIRSLNYYHGDECDAEFAYAFRLCGCESNRFSRLIQEVAMTNNLRIAELMIYRLPEYGTVSDVGFLSHCVDVGHAPVAAAAGVLQLQGVCSNSISTWSRSIAWTNASPSFGELLCFRFMDLSTNANVCAEDYDRIKAVAVEHAINHRYYHSRYDLKMIGCYPDYAHSYARLQALSNGLERNTYQYNITYITNALRELAELPASALHPFP